MDAASGIISLAGWALSIAATALTVGLGVILIYHWHRFALSRTVAAAATMLYIAVGSVFLLALFATASII